MAIEVETAEGGVNLQAPPPLRPDQALDPYDNLAVYAVRPMTHVPDETCRFCVPHPREVCKYVNPNAPISAAELSELPRALAQPEPAPPWETTP